MVCRGLWRAKKSGYGMTWSKGCISQQQRSMMLRARFGQSAAEQMVLVIELITQLQDCRRPCTLSHARSWLRMPPCEQFSRMPRHLDKACEKLNERPGLSTLRSAWACCVGACWVCLRLWQRFHLFVWVFLANCDVQWQHRRQQQYH